MGGDHHYGGCGAGNKRSRSTSSLTGDEGETSRGRKSSEGAPFPGGCCSVGETGDACGAHSQAAPHGSSTGSGEEDCYMYESDDCAGADEEDYIYEYDDDGGGEGEGEGAEQAQDGAAGVPAAAARGAEQRYVVLTEEDIRARQDADTAKVAEVLSIPPGFAAVLLRHFRWRVGRVQEEWFTDEPRVRAAVGLPDHHQLELVPASRGAGPTPRLCGICFDEFPAPQTAAAGCRAHFYCDACWRGYVRAAVADGPRCLSLTCPEPSCSAPAVRELVDEVLGGGGNGDGARYKRFWLRSYVEESGGKLRWCGGAGCTRALELVDGAAEDVVCACGHGVCWSCGEEAHRPVSCVTVRAWVAKNSSDAAETANWVVAHTKPCPKCGRPIEKNQGCNHMRCSPPCGHHFCWLCLQPAGGVGAGANHYACNDPRAGQPGGANDDDEYYTASIANAGNASVREKVEEELARRRRARAALERYLYHYERWASNGAALESAARDTAALEGGELERMARAADVPATELAFVAEAYRQVADGRRALRWAHAYGYFLDPERDAAKRALFDDLQNQANRWLECLHAAAELERKDLFGDGGECKGKGKGKKAAEPVAVGVVDNEAFRAYRQKVANLTAVTRKFLGNLVRAFETDLPEVAAAAAAVDPTPTLAK